MNEIERKGAKDASLSKAAKTWNAMLSDNTVQGMRTAVFLERKITEAEREQIKSEANPVIEETPVPTGNEIRQAREEGEYR